MAAYLKFFVSGTQRGEGWGGGGGKVKAEAEEEEEEEVHKDGEEAHTCFVVVVHAAAAAAAAETEIEANKTLCGISEKKIFPFSSLNLKILCCAMDKGELTSLAGWCTLWNALGFVEQENTSFVCLFGC